LGFFGFLGFLVFFGFFVAVGIDVLRAAKAMA
jgi:hypothetical protein